MLSTSLMIDEIAVSGVSYSDHEEIIEKIAKAKAYQYGPIGFFGIEDIKQEVRLKCWEALRNKYNTERGTNVYAFLSVCADHRIKDIKRSVMYKHNKPCLRCPFWNAAAASSGVHDCMVYWDKMDCERYAKHERYVQAKLSSSHPIDIDGERIEDKVSFRHSDKVDLIDFIETRLPSTLMPSFAHFKANNYNPKSLKVRERATLMRMLRNILRNYDERWSI